MPLRHLVEIQPHARHMLLIIPVVPLSARIYLEQFLLLWRRISRLFRLRPHELMRLARVVKLLNGTLVPRRPLLELLPVNLPVLHLEYVVTALVIPGPSK
jgi:hypothetical protein